MTTYDEETVLAYTRAIADGGAVNRERAPGARDRRPRAADEAPRPPRGRRRHRARAHRRHRDLERRAVTVTRTRQRRGGQDTRKSHPARQPLHRPRADDEKDHAGEPRNLACLVLAAHLRSGDVVAPSAPARGS